MSTVSQIGQGQAASFGYRFYNRGVVFLLHKLPFDPQDNNNAPEAQEPDLRYSIQNLAATYISPLEQILSSNLNAAGYVHAICVNFGPRGYFHLNHNTKPITQPAALEAQLRDLFRDGVVSNPDNNELIWRTIPDLSSLIFNLSPSSLKIGCLHGAGSGGLTNIRNYITNAPDEQIYVFVVGEIDNQRIQAYINDYVQVCEHDLNTPLCLSRVISEMEAKWGI